MDDLVLQSMQRWPDVPAVHGWLSLDARGRWMIHANGRGLESPPEPGEAITNSSLIAFINRNYASDEQGLWFFQNGPQRVYVRIDAAPYIVRLSEDGISLQTHTGQTLQSIDEWLLDDVGNLYIRSEPGPGRIENRDLPLLLDNLRTTLPNMPSTSLPLFEALEAGAIQGMLSCPKLPDAPWRLLTFTDIQKQLGFTAASQPV